MKKLVSLLFKLLPIIAVIFAALYLFQLDATNSIPKPNWFFLAISLPVLFIVFFIKAFIWYRLLVRFHINIGFKNAFISQCKSILLKYVPGKIWVILGRANIVAGLGYSLEYCSFVSAFCQFLMTATGLFIGMLGVILFNFFPVPPIAVFILLGILFAALLIFSRGNTIPSFTSKRLPAKSKNISGKRIPPVADIILLSIIHWLFMGEAFLLFFQSLGYHPGLCTILLQPLANNIGIISYFAPGGLGVREGVMVGYLAMAHIPLPGATSIALASRIWFFVAEALTYGSSYMLK